MIPVKTIATAAVLALALAAATPAAADPTSSQNCQLRRALTTNTAPLHSAPTSASPATTEVPAYHWALMSTEQPDYVNGTGWIQVVVNGEVGYLSSDVANGPYLGTGSCYADQQAIPVEKDLLGKLISQGLI